MWEGGGKRNGVGRRRGLGSNGSSWGKSGGENGSKGGEGRRERVRGKMWGGGGWPSRA